MVPTQVLLAALAALAEPAPTQSLPPPPELPPQFAEAESMRFLHPVMTNTQTPTAQAPAHHTDQPKRRGGGGNSGGGGGGMGQSAATAAGGTPLASMLNGVPGLPAPSTEQTPGTTPTDPSNPSVLPPPTAPTADPAALAPAFTLTSPPTTASGGSNGVSAVVPDALPEAVDSPVVETPEPGTMILLALAGAGVGGGTLARKWMKRKQK